MATVNDIIEAWNSQADDMNQWCDLDSDERVEFAIRHIERLDGISDMEELTQPQKFTIWYERICRDRDYAARYYDLADRTIRKEMEQRMIKLTDTEMLDWIESNLFSVVMDRVDSIGEKESVEVEYETEDGRWIEVRGRNLRDTIRKAMESER